LAERDKLNKEINGVTVPMLVKGLRQQIEEQLTIKDRGDAEDRYVIGFVTNRESEFDLVRKRRDAMLARIEEIVKYTDLRKLQRKEPAKKEPEKDPKKEPDKKTETN